MKLGIIAAAFIVANPALAAEKISINISMNELSTLFQGLNMLDGTHKIVKNALGADVDVVIPYTFNNPGVRLTIAHNDAVLQQRVNEFRRAITGVKPEEQNRMAAAPFSIEVLSFTAQDIGADKNDFPPSVLAELAPVCPSCAGLDASPAAAK